MADSNEPYFQIGEVAKRTGVTQRTLRFYEEKGLLKPPTRMEGGFRLYSKEDVRRVDQIRQLQDLLGLKLAEIKEMVEAESMLRELYKQSLHADRPEQRRQLERAIEIVKHQYEIVKHKREQMEQMEAQIVERLKNFDRAREYLEEAERQAASTAAPQ